MDIVVVQSCSDRSFITYRVDGHLEHVTIVFTGFGGGHLPVLGLSPEQATVVIKATGITPTEVKLFKDRYVFKYELEKTKPRAASSVSAYPPENIKSEIDVPTERAYMVVLTRRNGESEIESTHMVIGDKDLTKAMVTSVGLNFVTNGDCLHFSSDDDAFSDGESLFWINSIAEVEQSDIQTVAKYITPVHYEILLQGGEAKEES